MQTHNHKGHHSTHANLQRRLGLAAAILIDATIVRAALLPTTMKLLGDWNWYLPNWLQRLPRLEHRGSVERIEALLAVVPIA